MYVSLSFPGADVFWVDKTVSSSCGVKGVSVSACSLFAGYIECSLSGCCFSRADLTYSGKVWWSALMAKWCAILLVPSLGLITLRWEYLPRNVFISRQICAEPMSPSCLHQLSNWSCLIVWSHRLFSRWTALSSALFWDVGWALKTVVSLLTSLVHLLASGVKKDRGRLGRFLKDYGGGFVAASLISTVNLWRRSSRDILLSALPAYNSCSLSANVLTGSSSKKV